MNKEQFLEEMIDVLQTEEEITEETVLEDLDEWDSLSIMSTMAFFNKELDIKIPMETLKTVKTIADIIALAGDKIQ